jgi:hypothetical protein
VSSDEEDPNELVVLIKVLDILKLRIETRDVQNHEMVQVRQIVNQFLPGAAIGNFIQDLSTDQLGDVVVGDKYEVHGRAQVGAIGKGAKVRTVTFANSEGGEKEVELDSLLEELQSLRSEMRSRAKTTEEDLAVVAVGQAISAAEQGEKSEIFGHLKSAGKWAMGLATAIGAGVAAGAIKSALSL